MVSAETYIKCFWARIRRFRHRSGYGVHSPYAYNFLRDVVYERGNYYAYAELRKLRRASPDYSRELTGKSFRLLFRLSNFIRPRSVLVVSGNPDLAVAHIKAGCRNADIMTYATAVRSIPRDKDIYYCDKSTEFFDLYLRALAYTTPRAFIAAGIHSSPQAGQAWSLICRDPRSVITFDLYEVGIVLFPADLHKQNYIVSF